MKAFKNRRILKSLIIKRVGSKLKFMKNKKKFNALTLRKTSVANLKLNQISGGYKNDTRRDCITQFQACSNVNCYSDRTCYETEFTCDEPVTATVIGCQTNDPIECQSVAPYC
jgi:hypothetical protein